MAKNKQIEKYLRQAESKRNYVEGMELYLEFSIDLRLQQKFVIGGETVNNRSVLFKELKALKKIDPKDIEKQKAEITEKLEAQKINEKIKELKNSILGHIANKDLEGSKDVFEELLKICDCENDIEDITEAITGLKTELEEEEKEENANDKLFKANTAFCEITDVLKKFELPLEAVALKASFAEHNQKLKAQTTAAIETSTKLVEAERLLVISRELLKGSELDQAEVESALKPIEPAPEPKKNSAKK